MKVLLTFDSKQKTRVSATGSTRLKCLAGSKTRSCHVDSGNQAANAQVETAILRQKRVRGRALPIEYQDRQQPNTVRHLTEPPTTPGWIRTRSRCRCGSGITRQRSLSPLTSICSRMTARSRLPRQSHLTRTRIERRRSPAAGRCIAVPLCLRSQLQHRW